MSLDITINDFPALRDALDTIAEHDLSDANAWDEARVLTDAHAEAARLVRDARSSVIAAMDALRVAGYGFEDDDDA